MRTTIVNYFGILGLGQIVLKIHSSCKKEKKKSNTQKQGLIFFFQYTYEVSGLSTYEVS